MKYKKKNHSTYLYVFLLFIISLSLLFLLFRYYQHQSIKKNIQEHFQTSPSIYYINLDKSKERYHKMSKQCSSLSCIRVSAIDGKRLNKNDLFTIMKVPDMRLTNVACFLSHIKCLKEFMNTYDDYCIVLEDDVTIDPQLIKKLTTIKNELIRLNEYPDILFLGGTRVCGKQISEHVLKAVQIHGNCNAGAFGYMISKKGAQIILDNFERDGIYKMYDHQIRDYFPQMNVLYTNPPLVQHDFELPSDRLDIDYPKAYQNLSKSITYTN